MPPTEEKNAALVRRYLLDVVDGGDVDASDILLVADVEPAVLHIDDQVGNHNLQGLSRGILAAADVDVDVEELVADENRVAVRCRISDMLGGVAIEPHLPGRTVTIDFVGFYGVQNDQITEMWSLPDELGLVSQLGLLPDRSDDIERWTEDTKDERQESVR